MMCALLSKVLVVIISLSIVAISLIALIPASAADDTIDFKSLDLSNGNPFIPALCKLKQYALYDNCKELDLNDSPKPWVPGDKTNDDLFVSQTVFISSEYCKEMFDIRLFTDKK